MSQPEARPTGRVNVGGRILVAVGALLIFASFFADQTGFLRGDGNVVVPLGLLAVLVGLVLAARRRERATGGLVIGAVVAVGAAVAAVLVLR